MRMGRSVLAVAFVVAALGGCALKKPPERVELTKEALPNLQAPAAWTAPAGAAGTAGAVASAWLATFRDPQLDSLVEEALRYNPDLRVAATRVEQAASYVKVAGATLLPQVTALARGGGALSGDSSGLQGVGIFANWELDLWGRVRAGRAAASTQYDSSTLDAEYARQSLAALVAKSWFLATEARLQKAIAEDMAAAAGRQLDLAQQRQRVGSGDQNDVTLARASLATYRDSVRNLEYSYRQSLRALEALAGRYPAAQLEAPAQLAVVPGPVPAGMPSELLERRPDIVAAERRVAIAFYRGGVHRLERPVRAQGPRQPGLERRRLDRRAALPRRPAAGAGRDPHRGAEAGARGIRPRRRARLRRGGKRARRRHRARGARGNPQRGRVRERAGAGVCQRALPRRRGRPARRAAAEPGAERGAHRPAARAVRAAGAARQPAPRPGRKLPGGRQLRGETLTGA